MPLFDITISRIVRQTKTVRVTAVSRYKADEEALELAPHEDFSGCGDDYYYEVERTKEVDAETQIKELAPGAAVPSQLLPSYEELEASYRDGQADLAVVQPNHREYVRDGTRFCCGWSSAGTPEREVVGWVVYRGVREPKGGDAQ